MALKWTGILNRNIGKDITNFVSGHYTVDTNGIQNMRGYLYTLPDGVWDEVTLLSKFQINDNGLVGGGTTSVVAPQSSLIWTTKIPGYRIEYDGSLTKISNWTTIHSSITKTFNETEISQWAVNDKVIAQMKAIGMNFTTEYQNEFRIWALNMKVAGYGTSFDVHNFENNVFDFDVDIAYYMPNKVLHEIIDIGTMPSNNTYLFPMYYVWYTQVKGEKPSNVGDINEILDLNFISEWTLYVEGLDSGNPLFTWRWASNSFDGKFITQEESKVEIEYGTFWNEDVTDINMGQTEVNEEFPPITKIINWETNDFNITLDEIWATTNSKPKVTDDIFTQANKRKIFFRIKSICGENESSGILVVLWESGYIIASTIGGIPDGYILYGDDTFRYITEVAPPSPPSGGDDEDNDGEDDGSDGDENAGNPTASAQLGTTYTMNSNTFRAIRQWLWSADFFDNIMLINNNPIENIVSAKVFPFEQGGIPSPIILGNVDSNYTGQLQRTTVRKFSDIAITVPTYYNNYLDFSPYTDIKIHLPFIGIKPLDTSVVMGKTINVRYLVDLVLGQCQCDILLNGRVINSYVGMIGIDLPISGQNRSEVEIGYITSALTTTFSAIAGEPIGAVLGISNGISNKFRTETTGQYNPNMQMYSDYDIYLIIERPTLTIPANYGSTEGYPLNRSGQIKSYSGYTICDNVDTSSIKALSEERTEIKTIMENGFYI